MIWFWLLFPLVVQAATLPQPSDVVFIHAGESDEQQIRYNYIFTVDGYEGIHTCQANRCSLLPFRDHGSINATFYQLPEGYQRVANIVDQAVLSDYITVATSSYRFDQLETDLAGTGDSRSYHTVTIAEDGSYQRDTTTQERNPEEVLETTRSRGWLWLMGGVVVAVLAAVGFILWKRKN